MPFSKLEQLWDGVQDLDKLKCINLCKSVNLKEIPDLSRAPNLERIYLQYCTILIKVPWNTLRSNKLIDLDLRGCRKLSSTLPERIFALSTLKTLNVEGSNVKVTALPETISRGLVSLNLDSTGIQSLPSSIGSLENLSRLNLNNCKSFSNIPSSIHKLKSLKYLGLAQCSFLDEFPVLLPWNLETLDLSWTAIKEIPSSSTEDCPGLQEINLQGCKMIECVPSNIFEFQSLRNLYLDDCSNLKSLPEISKPMGSLEYLGLACTGIRQLPSSIGNLIGIKVLNLKNCANLESIPENIYNLTRLETLELSNCRKLENIPPPIGFRYSGIEYLELSDSNISEIPPGIVGLYKLKHLIIENCKNLRSIPELPLSLNILNASGCTSLERVSSSKRVLSQWFQARHRFHTNGVTVDFRNFFECLKMDQNSRDEISSDYQLRVLAKAIQYKLYQRCDSTVVCYPGNEIPKWFDYQSEGSSCTIALTPQWHNANFLGFAFCIVIDGKACKEFSTSSVGYRDFKCKFNFKIRDTEGVHSFYWSVFNVPRQLGSVPWNSDHLFLWYQHQDYNDCHDAVEVSLEFSFVNKIGYCVESSTKEVKRCGIHLLYRDDLKDLEIDHKCDVDSEATHEDEPSEDETTDADERHPKKIKHSN
ncbi:hypothetical protein TIFTF001_046145 [Ficus carica]|uniref:Uncharacterized protein n=1 Tax=Ficus carica TaxID=3494 RepID=A0AA87Z895_FICCA|nr:hypothetical protein TIFTF001_046145 [Ficus carica]